MRILFFLTFAVWALLTLYVVVWVRERYGRGGPIPVSQGLLGVSETLTDPDYQLVGTVRDVCRATGFEPVEHSRERLGYTVLFRSP